jgi:hypothetical protein
MGGLPNKADGRSSWIGGGLARDATHGIDVGEIKSKRQNALF